ncbi:hypothetical protein [Peijinzhouia sedimentorum]
MKLLELIINRKKLEIKRSILGNETVFLDNKLVSRKRTLFGTSHNIEIAGQNYELKYAVKSAWKKLTGQPTFQINSNGVLLSEHNIKNSSFLTIQFLIGLIATYFMYLIIMMIIESAKNGFVYDAH